MVGMTDQHPPLLPRHERFVRAVHEDGDATGAGFVEPKICDHSKPAHQVTRRSANHRRWRQCFSPPSRGDGKP